jgi:hypothetical protein
MDGHVDIICVCSLIQCMKQSTICVVWVRNFVSYAAGRTKYKQNQKEMLWIFVVYLMALSVIQNIQDGCSMP